MADDNNADDKADDKINDARRRLLRAAVYVPPAVIGIVSLTQGCAPGSCSPGQCTPLTNCHPNQPCNPHP